MSCDYYAELVVGVLISDLKPRQEERVETVVRYDPITGEPYDKETTYSVLIINGKELKMTLSDMVDELLSEQPIFLGNIKYPECFIYDNLYKPTYNSLSKIPIGVSLSSANQNEYTAETTQISIDEAKVFINKFFFENFGLDLEPKILSVLSVC